MATIETQSPISARIEGLRFQDRNPLVLIVEFGRRYPRRSILVLIAFFVSGLAEGLGFVSLLPLFNIVFDTADATSAHSATTELTEFLSDALLAVGLQPTLAVILGIIVACIGIKGTTRFLALRYIGYVLAEIATDLRRQIVQSVVAARWGYFLSQPIGKFANAIGIESTKAAGAYQQGASVVAAAIQTTVFLTLAFMISWQVTLAAIAAGAFMLVSLRYFVVLARTSGQRQAALFQVITSRLIDGLQGIKPIKAMGREQWLSPILDHDTEELRITQRQQVLAREALVAIQEPIIVALIAIGFFVAVTHTDIPIGTVIVLAVLFQRATGSIGRMQGAYQALGSATGFYWAIRESCLEAEAAAEVDTGWAEPELEDAVRLRDVSFSYDHREVLDHVSMEVPVGQVTAIIGPSGSGKTTIVDLICGLQTPLSGAVLLDDRPLGEISLSAWRSRIGYVPQELFLFHDTVLRNVTLGDPDISPDDARDALRLAGLGEFISSLPQGLETVVGERGITFSGGQRQRVALARALARKPALLILDEATASLDPKTERSILETLRGLTGEITILAISHQPAIVDTADRVYRIADGQLSLVQNHPAGDSESRV